MKLRTKIAIVLAVVFAALLVWAAGPPPGTYIVPSFFTTNAAKIIGTNGIGVSSNTVNGTYFIDGRNLTNGLSGGGPTNIFNPFQFAQVGVGGTNVNIKDGATITNADLQFHNGAFSTILRSDLTGGLEFESTDLGGHVFTIDAAGNAYFPIMTAGRVLTTTAGGRLQAAANGTGAFTNNSVEGYGWFNGFATTEMLSNTLSFDATQFQRTGVGGTNIVIKSGALLTNVLTIASNNVLLTASPTQVDFYGFTLITNSNNKISVGASTGTGSGATNIFNPNQFTQIGAGGTNVNIKDGVLLTNLLDYGTATFDGTLQDSAANKWNIQANGAANFGGLVSGFDNVGGLFVGSGPLFNVPAVDGNIGIIKGLSGYIWPSAHAAGYLRNDAGGGLSWDIPTNSLTFDTTQFSRTGVGGTNIALKSGFQGTNAALFGVNTNNGSMDTAGGVTNWSTTLMVGAVESRSTSTNAGAQNNAAPVTNWSSTLMVGAIESRSTSTNAGAQNNASGVTNWSNVRNVGAVENQSTTTNTGAINNAAPVTNWNLTASTVMAVNAGKQEISIPNPTVGAGMPLIFNGTNGFFDTVDDGWFLTDEFNGTAAIQSPPWVTAGAGVTGANIKFSSTNWGEVVFTNGPSSGDRAGVVNPSLTATYIVTNTELWCYVRMAAGIINSATISNHLAFGIGDTFSGSTSNGIWIQMAPKSTVWQAVVATAGAVTTNSLTIAATKDEWREFVWHLDQTQTSVYFYSGARASTSTIWCTNTIALPTTAMCWFFTSRRQATQTSGSATNSIDHFKVWKRNLL